MIELMAHQRQVVERARTQRRLGLWMDPGTGKTITVLGIHRERPMRTLVVAPRSVMRAAWLEDARRMGLAEHVYVAHGRAGQRGAALRAAAGDAAAILVTTFETFRGHADAFAGVGIERLVVDESSRMKNAAAKVTKRLMAFAQQVGEVYLLSGTPMPNGPDEAWPQLYALDASPGGLADRPRPDGWHVPPRFHPWAAHWLRPIKRPIGDKLVTERYELPASKREAWNAMMARAAVRIDKRDCLDLPGTQVVPVAVDLEPRQRKTYDQLATDGVGTTPDGASWEVQAMGLAMKLRQVSAGVLRDDAGTWHPVGDAKLQAIDDLVTSLSPGEPLIVWTQFRAEATRVVEQLEALGRRTARADGTVRDVDAEVQRFVAGEATALVAHPATVGHGVTLVQCGGAPVRFVVYASLDYSAERWQQSLDRTHRKGQREPVTYYVLEARGTLDQTIYKALQRKQDASAAVLDALRQQQGCHADACAA